MKYNPLSFIRLPRREKIFFFRSIFLLSKYRVRLKTTPLETLIAQVEQERRAYQDHKKADIPLPQVCKLIHVAAGLVPLSTCLSNALAGQLLFAANHYPTTLHIGVRNSADSDFEAHAWLSLNGEVLMGGRPDLDSYKEFPALPRPKL